MSNRIFLFFARFAYRLMRPFIPLIKRYIHAYRNLKARNLYHSGAVTIKDFCFVEKELKFQPLVSIVVPVFNPNESHLLEMFYSVINQHYSKWELILVNASSQPAIRHKTEELSQADSRVRVVAADNEGISANTNKGLNIARGDYIAFLDHDDLLHPCALHSVVEAMQVKNQPGIVYTDEDKIDEASQRFFDPHYKPAWSPDLLRNVNYINHLTLIKTDYVKTVGGLRPACDGAQDYDLLLRVIDQCQPRIKHVSRVLYHWRAAEQSTAADISTKQYIFKAGTKALNDHLKRAKIAAKAKAIKGKPGFYELEYSAASFSIIIGRVSASKYGACAAWLDRLAQLLPDDGEIVVGEWYRDFQHTAKDNVKFVRHGKDYWRRAAKAASKEVVICYKIAANPVTPKGLSKLAAVAAGSPNSIIMPPIINRGQTIFHSGIINSYGGPQNLFEGYIFGRSSFFGNTDWVRNVDSLATSVLAMKRQLLLEILKTTPQDYNRISSTSAFVYHSEKPKSIVWAHTPFEYIGPLKFSRDNYYHRIQQFRLIPTSIMVMYADNWGERYERDSE